MVVTEVPLLPQRFTYEIDAADTCVAQDEKTSWFASLGLVAKQRPAVGVLVGKLNL